MPANHDVDVMPIRSALRHARALAAQVSEVRSQDGGAYLAGDHSHHFASVSRVVLSTRCSTMAACVITGVARLAPYRATTAAAARSGRKASASASNPNPHVGRHQPTRLCSRVRRLTCAPSSTTVCIIRGLRMMACARWLISDDVFAAVGRGERARAGGAEGDGEHVLGRRGRL
jgi:hypothetical protein